MNLKKLETWWWSPEHPHKYVTINPETGKYAGVGVLLQRAPEMATRFNVVWSVYGNAMKTWEGSRNAVSLMTLVAPQLSQPAEGGTLGELSCLYTLDQFMRYCREKNVKLKLPHVQRT